MEPGDELLKAEEMGMDSSTDWEKRDLMVCNEPSKLLDNFRLPRGH
jgi:hypothetical protein